MQLSSMLYLFDDMLGFTDADLQWALTVVSPQRRDKALRYKSVSARKQSVIAELLLREGLRREYGLSQLPEMAIGEHGKPYFPKYSYIHFSLSHCSEAVVCALSSRSVGVDVERVGRGSLAVAAYALNEQELSSVRADHALGGRGLDGPACLFTRLWTMKEARVKQLGTGIAHSDIKHLLSLDACTARFETIVADRYVCTTAFSL